MKRLLSDILDEADSIWLKRDTDDRTEAGAKAVLKICRERGWLTPEAIEQLRREGL